jgi:lysophospholipase L1-like esterase
VTAQPRILALGDSYTIGEGIAPEDAWPARVATLLSDAGMPRPEVTVIARTGWTTNELAAAIHVAAPREPYDYVTLLIGVNNQYRGRPLVEYRGEFRHLLRRAIGFAAERPERVIVISIPDWSVTPFADGRDRTAIARDIDAFNAVNREEADRAGTVYVDITPASRRGKLVVGDGLHPSGAMHAIWAGLIADAIEQLR